MEVRKSTVERAFELAATGRFRTVEEVRAALHNEGYNQHQIVGPALTRQLREIIRLATLK